MKYSLLIILSLPWLSITATGINPETRLRLSQDNAQISRSDDEPPYRPLLLQLADESTVEKLIEMGVIIYNHREDIYLTSVPKQNLEEVLNIDGVLNAATTGQANSCMDIARDFSNVNYLSSSTGILPSNYNGEGVVIGFSDIGFDAQHIAFSGHISRIYDYESERGIEKSAETPEEIASWTTDNPNNFHATHVANILAGSYMGNEYYGVATGADIVATTSRLHDVGILAGVEQIIAYAKAQCKPVVINLSLGSYIGPHDGSDLVCRYLSYCAQDAIICISAGNNGIKNCSAYQNLEKGNAFVTPIGYNSPGSVDIKGYVDIWSDSSQPFEYCFGVLDKDLCEPVYTTGWITPADSFTSLIDTEDNEFAKYFKGQILSASELSGLNNRFNATIYFNVSTTTMSDIANRSKYFGYIAVRQPDDASRPVKVSIFTDAQDLTFYGSVYEAEYFGSQGSINNLCCADGVISVGMANSRNIAPALNGENYEWNFADNTINENSSYNTIPNVKVLPHFCAPGSYVISALSGEYYKGHPEVKPSAVSEVDGKDYYWFPAQGTSMASPFVAGVIATWLQADNTLTSEKVIEIAQKTAIRDYSDINDPRWGAGCINVYAGLCEVIAESGIINPESNVVVEISDDRHLEIYGIDENDVNLYNASGMKISKKANLASGIYILALPNGEVKKISVR